MVGDHLWAEEPDCRSWQKGLNTQPWIHCSLLLIPTVMGPAASRSSCPHSSWWTASSTMSKTRDRWLEPVYYKGNQDHVEFFLNIFYYIFLLCVYPQTGLYATVYMWEPGDNLWKSILSFCHVDSGAWTHVVSFGGNCLYPLLWLLLFFFVNLTHTRVVWKREPQQRKPLHQTGM